MGYASLDAIRGPRSLRTVLARSLAGIARQTVFPVAKVDEPGVFKCVYSSYDGLTYLTSSSEGPRLVLAPYSSAGRWVSSPTMQRDVLGYWLSNAVFFVLAIWAAYWVSDRYAVGCEDASGGASLHLGRFLCSLVTRLLKLYSA